MTLTGSWLAGELLADTDQKFGFFLLPAKMRTRHEWPSAAWEFLSPSEKPPANPDLAAEYLDWMVSPRAAQLWAEAGMLPAMPLPADAKVEEGTLFTDTMVAWNTINKENAVGHYIDWTTPTFL